MATLDFEPSNFDFSVGSDLELDNNPDNPGFDWLGAMSGLNSLAGIYMSANESSMRRLRYKHEIHMAEINKWFLERETEKSIEKVRKQGEQVLGAARVAGADSGFSLSSESQLVAEQETVRSIEEDVSALKMSGKIKAFNIQSDIGRLGAQDRDEKAAQTGRQISTLLTTATDIRGRIK